MKHIVYLILKYMFEREKWMVVTAEWFDFLLDKCETEEDRREFSPEEEGLYWRWGRNGSWKYGLVEQVLCFCRNSHSGEFGCHENSVLLEWP